eukprot:362825-Chlamydomonas_euryale.AAC.5
MRTGWRGAEAATHPVGARLGSAPPCRCCRSSPARPRRRPVPPGVRGAAAEVGNAQCAGASPMLALLL